MNDFCQNAIAYIKFSASSSSSSASKTLPVEDDKAPVIRSLGNGMVVVYVVDKDDGLYYVHQHHLKAEGVNANQLHQIGVKNLRAHVAGQLEVHKRGPIFTTLVDGNFEASLVLIDDLWEKQFKSLVTNEIVIAMPDRIVLAFCDSKSADGIALLKEVIRREYDEAEHPLSKSLFVRRNGAWSPFE